LYYIQHGSSHFNVVWKDVGLCISKYILTQGVIPNSLSYSRAASGSRLVNPAGSDHVTLCHCDWQRALKTKDLWHLIKLGLNISAHPQVSLFQ